jgi:hypothetical protein
MDGHGTAPDLIYVRGVANTPTRNPITFNRKKCNLILVEVGFYTDFECHTKVQEKNTKYAPSSPNSKT